VIIIFTVLALSMTQIIENEDGDTNTEPLPDQNDIFPSATFVLPDGNMTFFCEIADTIEERQEGLMNRESLDNNTGMLFVFDSSLNVEFWMKNTLIPLDIIFINETGHVVNVEEAYPEPDTPDNLLERYESNGPILWVLEINQGICAENEIGPGTFVKLKY